MRDGDQVDQVEENRLETAADREAAGVPEPAEYKAHQEPPQHPDGGLPVALRDAPAKPTRKPRATPKPRTPRASKKK